MPEKFPALKTRPEKFHALKIWPKIFHALNDTMNFSRCRYLYFGWCLQFYRPQTVPLSVFWVVSGNFTCRKQLIHSVLTAEGWWSNRKSKKSSYYSYCLVLTASLPLRECIFYSYFSRNYWHFFYLSVFLGLNWPRDVSGWVQFWNFQNLDFIIEFPVQKLV